MNPADLFRLETDTTTLSPGEWVFRQGEKGDSMYVLLEGDVDIIVGETVVETAERGALLGEMALIDNSPRSASAVARTPCRLVAINRKRFIFMVQQTPNFSIHVMKVMAERLRRMDGLLVGNRAQETRSAAAP
jgi:CRP/FNR family cyclic AMP-dependent transcriptional regulator